MKHSIATLITATGITLSALAQAANVAPLGLEVGKVTLAQVKARLGNTRLQQAGINAYSDGPMLESDGQGLDVEGMEKIVFIFDKGEKLSGVLMTLPNQRFDEVHRFLSGKYPVQTKNIPFVGDRYVRYAKGDSIAEVSAPHMSFAMEVRYLSNGLLQAYRQRSSASETQRRQAQSEKF